MMLFPRRQRLGLGVALVAVLAISIGVACSSGGGGGGKKKKKKDHTNITLLDRHGNPLTATSTEPFSPRQTCGACHDVDAIANGFHFSQGRTDASGVVQVMDDFFADGRTYVRSPGMYGKW